LYREAIGIGERTGNAQVRSEARVGLAVCLLTGDLDGCRTIAEQAAAIDYPSDRAKVATLIGIICLRQDPARPGGGSVHPGGRPRRRASGPNRRGLRPTWTPAASP
jgi:hypothetical protein